MQIPIKAFASDTEDGSTPEKGDVVELRISGTVASIDKDFAEVVPESVNGEPLPKEAADHEAAEPPDKEAEEEAALQAMHEKPDDGEEMGMM